MAAPAFCTWSSEGWGASSESTEKTAPSRSTPFDEAASRIASGLVGNSFRSSPRTVRSSLPVNGCWSLPCSSGFAGAARLTIFAWPDAMPSHVSEERSASSSTSSFLSSRAAIATRSSPGFRAPRSARRVSERTTTVTSASASSVSSAGSPARERPSRKPSAARSSATEGSSASGPGWSSFSIATTVCHCSALRSPSSST
mmetsp:Transcript_2503/g.5943  ORF Transcript_2503/g.5943 Transcript_2503/m.5943 type:complete len:200 (+) Transcript_2503:737-1336(+)